MNPFVVAICAFVILLGYEIRFRNMVYEMNLLKAEVIKLGEGIQEMKEEAKPNQDAKEAISGQP